MLTGASHKPVKPVVAYTKEGFASHGPDAVLLLPSSLQMFWGQPLMNEVEPSDVCLLFNRFIF